MSTHEDWAAMKQARDNAAIHAARALVNGDIEHAQKWAAAYDDREHTLLGFSHKLGI